MKSRRPTNDCYSMFSGRMDLNPDWPASCARTTAIPLFRRSHIAPSYCCVGRSTILPELHRCYTLVWDSDPRRVLSGRFGSIASHWRCPSFVRLTPDSEQIAYVSALRFRANNCLTRCNKTGRILRGRPAMRRVQPAYRFHCEATRSLSARSTARSRPTPARRSHRQL
jgi:hypothetical protein